MEKNPNPLFSVSDFLAVVNQTLEFAYGVVEIEGEVANFKVNQQKYVFFDIKDLSASVPCFMTVWQLRVPIEDGMKVVVRATPKVTAWGKFSVTVQAIRPSGEGSIKKSFELLKEKLSKEGLFAPKRKRLLPSMPAHIAVISSTQAAGYTDFITILNNRWGGLNVEVAHVQVQGEAAADQIIRAIRHFNEQSMLADVLVLVRGGGSADDLAVFNDERLVRELAASRIPTLVGVGHEVDESLADMVADVRAATPSNAAEIIVPDKRELLTRTELAMRTIARTTNQRLEQTERTIKDLVGQAAQRMQHGIGMRQQTLARLVALLTAYNPNTVLARGYALVRGNEQVGGTLFVERHDKTITTEVKHVEQKNNAS
ncbi:MAG: exodeoxyribonuclease VII large subunit [Candidatus Saccharimonas sp.]